jgi:hypothetical protein
VPFTNLWFSPTGSSHMHQTGMLCAFSLLWCLQVCSTMSLLVTVKSLHFFTVASQTMTFQLSQLIVAFLEVPDFTVNLDRSKYSLCLGTAAFLVTFSFHTFSVWPWTLSSVCMLAPYHVSGPVQVLRSFSILSHCSCLPAGSGQY